MSNRAREIANEKAWCIHAESKTIGKGHRYYTGEPGDQSNGANGPVLEMEDGNTFHAKNDQTFERLSDGEVLLYQVITEAVTGTIGELARFAASQNIARHTFEVLSTSVLSKQIRALNAALRKT